MKKLFFVFISLCFCALSVSAQSTKTLSGTIIDKYGNPVPGALIIATGGADNTTTDVDGNFMYEVPLYLESVTVKSPGMYNKKIDLRKRNAFRDGKLVVKMKPKTGSWFVEGVMGYHTETEMHIGLMGGFLGNNWGGYLKETYTVIDTFDFTFILGATKHIGNDMYLHFGTGIGDYAYWDNNRGWRRYSNVAQTFDFGVIKIFNNRMTASASITPMTDYQSFGLNIAFGVGYAF